jgi:hypothetical protein
MEVAIIITDMPALAGRLKEDVLASRHAGMTNVVEEIDARSVPHTPVITSNLVNSRTHEVSADGLKGTCRNTAPYSGYVHEGTGIYGPYKTPIVPVHAKALKTPYGYRKSVKGQKPQPFYLEALAEIDPGQVYEDGQGAYIKKQGWN